MQRTGEARNIFLNQEKESVLYPEGKKGKTQ